MDALSKLQRTLIRKAQPLTSRTEDAFHKYPRHLFVPEYSLSEAYADHPLLIFEQYPYVSTISQPSFVLKILDSLEIEKGHKIFELGTGSGWNAALMSELTGPTGLVVSSEVIPEVAQRAQKILGKLNIVNVKVLSHDGFEGHIEDSPYDRIIFTAGSEEFPSRLFDQLKEGGRMAFVRQRPHESDLLEILLKEKYHWKVLSTTPCSFVSVIRKKETRSEGGALSW